jgi:hypothetical protein
MKRIYWIAGGVALLAVILVAVVLFLRPSGEQGRPAEVIEVVNQVDAHPRPKDDWQPAAVGMEVYGGGQVRTGAASAARLELLEGVVRLSADSLIPLRHQEFGPADRGLALEELEDGVYYLGLDAFSSAPEGTAGHGNECSAIDPAEAVKIVIQGGQVRIEEP